MKNDQYFKHDAGASGNRKLIRLIDELNMKDYAVYWLLMETLRMQNGYRAPIAILKRLAHRARVKPAFLLQIIQNYELFVVNDEHFHSPGMTRRMHPYAMKTTSTRCSNSSEETPNPLETNETTPPNARKEEKKEKRKEEEKKKEETPPAGDRPAEPPGTPHSAGTDRDTIHLFVAEPIVGVCRSAPLPGNFGGSPAQDEPQRDNRCHSPPRLV